MMYLRRNDWQLSEREALRHELTRALEALIRGYAAQGEYQAAIPYAWRWL
jgi:hypothetical protein